MSGRPRVWTLVVVGVAGFITTLDNTVVVVALPTIEADLNASREALEWVVTAYILAFAGLMLAGGRAADVYGCRFILLTGLIVFTAASMAAGLAPGQASLIAARVVQGAGAALVIPALLALVGQATTEKERSVGVAVWMATASGALAFGPVIGGLLSQHAHWGWIFLINGPPGIVSVVITALAVPESHDKTARTIDGKGAATSVVALTAGTFALIHGRELGWSSVPILSAFALAAVAAMTFVAIEARVREPMVEIALFRARPFTGGVIAQVLWGLGVNGVFFFTAMFLQTVLGFSPSQSGLAFVPLAGLLVVVTPFVPKIEEWLGARRTVAIGLIMVAAGMARVALMGPGDGWLELLPAVALMGTGSAMTMPLGSAVLGAVPKTRAGVAGGVFSVSREISGALGIAGVGAIVMALEETAIGEGASRAEAFMSGYSVGLLVAAALVLGGAAIAYATLPGRQPRQREVTHEDGDLRVRVTG